MSTIQKYAERREHARLLMRDSIKAYNYLDWGIVTLDDENLVEEPEDYATDRWIVQVTDARDTYYTLLDTCDSVFTPEEVESFFKWVVTTKY